MGLWSKITRQDEYKKTIQSLQDRLEEKTFRMSLLLELARVINSATNIEEILEIMLRAAGTVTQAEKLMIALGKEGRLNVISAKGIHLCQANDEMLSDLRNTPIWQVYLSGEIYNGKAFSFGSTEASAVFPLVAPQRVIGVLIIGGQKSLDIETERFLSIFCSQAALALFNAGNLKRAQNYANYYEHKASTDSLTMLYNRGFMKDQLTAEIERARRKESPLSLIMFDIDFFKKFNDSYGHLFGDHVLKEIAGLVKNNIRAYDYPIRYGGEEFLIILPETTAEQGAVVAEKLRKKVERHNFIDPYRKDINASVTISLGVVQWVDGVSMDMLIEQADNALYLSKEKGRNIVTVYNS